MKNIKDVKKVALLLKIFSLLILVGVLSYVIYNYVKNSIVDVWCLCICIILAIIVSFVYFTKTFMWNKGAKRNRILLYIFVILACLIPTILNIISSFASGAYVNNEQVMSLIDSGLPTVFVGILWGVLVALLYSCICAVIAIYVEKSIIPKNEQMLEEAKAKIMIELQKQEALKKEQQKQNNKTKKNNKKK